MTRRLLVTGVTAGVVAYIALQFAVASWAGRPGAADPMGLGEAFLGASIRSTATLLPALLGGFIATRHGFGVGYLAVMIGALLWWLLQLYAVRGDPAFATVDFSAVGIFLAFRTVDVGLLGAALGGAGQLLRSNFRMQRSG